MNLLVFVTDDGDGGSTAPTLFVKETPEAVLPDHPRSLEWKYFATISDQDELYRANVGDSADIEERGYAIIQRLV